MEFKFNLSAVFSLSLSLIKGLRCTLDVQFSKSMIPWKYIIRKNLHRRFNIDFRLYMLLIVVDNDRNLISWIVDDTLAMMKCENTNTG